MVSEQNRRDVGENFRGFVILGTPQKIRDDMLQISIQTQHTIIFEGAYLRYLVDYPNGKGQDLIKGWLRC